MQVILKKDVQNLGETGDVLTVKDGYARNFLIPKDFAEMATEGALKNREKNLARIRVKQEKLHQEALAKAELIEKIGTLELSAKAGARPFLHRPGGYDSPAGRYQLGDESGSGCGGFCVSCQHPRSEDHPQGQPRLLVGHRGEIPALLSGARLRGSVPAQ